MCTVTFAALGHGYALGMNRDESLARVTARPPARHALPRHRTSTRAGGDARQALFPSEPQGGTWIGVNDSGVTLALINWYGIAHRATGEGGMTVSRGTVVESVLHADSADEVTHGLEELSLALMNPFRLIGIFPAHQEIFEWRWDRQDLIRNGHPWETNTWISSGFDEPGAQRIRTATFRAALNPGPGSNVDFGVPSGWLRALHRAHLPDCGPYSTCMHRTDAATVSYTEVMVSDGQATMHYTPGAPCCTAMLPELRLALHDSALRIGRLRDRPTD